MSKFMDFAATPLGGAAVSAGSGMISDIANLIGQRQREKRYNKQQEKLMGMQHLNQKALNEQGKELAMQMWNETNYSAQRKHLEDAGLSVGLMYGQGGGGGTTANSGSGGSAASGSAAPIQPMDINALQHAGTLASIELTKAQAKKTEAEEEKIRGVDTDLGRKQIDNLSQGIKESGARIALMGVEQTGKEIQNWFESDAYNLNLEALKAEVNKLNAEARSAVANAGVDEGTVKTRINQATADLQNSYLDQLVKQSDIQLKGIQAEDLKNSILQKWETVRQGWRGLSLKEKEVKINQFNAEIKAEFPSISNMTGRVLQDAWDTLGELNFGYFGPKGVKDTTYRRRKVN